MKTSLLSVERQLSFTGERMCTKYWETVKEACPGTKDRLTDRARNDLNVSKSRKTIMQPTKTSLNIN